MSDVYQKCRCGQWLKRVTPVGPGTLPVAKPLEPFEELSALRWACVVCEVAHRRLATIAR